MLIEDMGTNMLMLQYLIEMGMRGNHMLFTADDIRRAFHRDISDIADIDSKTIREVNLALQELMEIKDIEDKRDYIQDLNTYLQDILIHLYFQMIDRTMYQSSMARH